jgi:hypothetical protein
MNENEFKPIAKQILNSFGLQAFDIPVKDGFLTPDFEVHGKSNKYVIELKIKSDDPIETANEFEELKKGGIVSKSIPIGPRNVLSGIIRKGVQQMVEHDPDRGLFRVIWLHSAGLDPELHFRRFQSTIFGSETLFSLRLKHIITCYYFHNSAFHAWREYLDGALLTYRNTGQLCINTLSPKVEDFRNSDLVLSMTKGLCDPNQIKGVENGVMIADCDIDRKDINGVIQYLQNKYSLDHLQTIPMKQHTGKIKVKKL